MKDAGQVRNEGRRERTGRSHGAEELWEVEANLAYKFAALDGSRARWEQEVGLQAGAGRRQTFPKVQGGYSSSSRLWTATWA